MLPCRESSLNRINPLLSSPSPKRPIALGHLAQKEEQDILSPICDNSRVVEDFVEGPNKPVESRPEVHRAAIAIELVGFRIARKHVCFNSRQMRRAVVSLQVDRPCPLPIVCFLGR